MLYRILHSRSPSFWTLAALILFSPVLYMAALNWLGPSTQYRNPWPATAERGADGNLYVYLGDEFYVTMTIVRHKLNGNCRFEITRYAEPQAGPTKGEKIPISYAVLQFVGQDEIRQTNWPQPPDKYILGYGVDEHNNAIMSRPLLPPGVDQLPFRFFVVGRYYCNPLDHIIPRYIQGGENPNETPSVRVIVRRSR